MAKRGNKAAQVVPLVTRQCPTCGKAEVLDFRPFCSKRCADRDLGRWLNEEYRIPTNEAPADTEGDGFLGDEDPDGAA